MTPVGASSGGEMRAHMMIFGGASGFLPFWGAPLCRGTAGALTCGAFAFVSFVAGR